MMLGQKKTRLTFESLEHRRVLSGSSVDSNFENAALEVTVGEPIRIIQFGDSVASGISPVDAANRGINPRLGYRPYLWDLIQNESSSKPNVEFVGTTTYNPTDLPPEAQGHSTYRGFATISFFPHPKPNFGSDPYGPINTNNNDANGWATLDPDVALIMLGTNDLLAGRLITDLPNYPTYRSIETSLRDMITELRDATPDVTVLLGTLPPYVGGTRVEEANDVIRNLVNADPEDAWTGTTSQSPIHLVDHYRGEGSLPAFTAAQHLHDNVHPNEAGDALLAANWWSVLQPIIDVNVAPPPPNPAAPAIVSMQTTSLSVNEGVSSVRVTVSRTDGVDDSLSVGYTVGGTADAGVDYLPLPNEITIPAGSSQASIVVDILNDSRVEPDETIIVELQDGSTYDVSPQNRTTIQLIDDDEPTKSNVAVSPVVHSIEESAGSVAAFRFSRDGDLSSPLTVFYSVSGSAENGEDFKGLTGELTIPAGRNSAVARVEIADDDIDEKDRESIIVELKRSSDYELTVSQSATVQILDDDVAGPPGVSIRNAALPEIIESGRGIMEFIVSRSGDLSGDLTVQLDIGGSAQRGADYAPPQETVVIPAGSNEARVKIALRDDVVTEGDESVVARIQASDDYQVDNAFAVITIIDNDNQVDVKSFFDSVFRNSPGLIFRLAAPGPKN